MVKFVVTLILLAIYFIILLTIRIIKKIDYKKIKKQEDLKITDWIITYNTNKESRISIELLQEYGIIEEFIYIFNENHINVKSIKCKLNKYKEEE